MHHRHHSGSCIAGQILKPSRRRNGLVILFTLIVINLFILCEYLTVGKASKFLPNTFLYHSDNTSYSSEVPITHLNSDRILLVSSLFIISKSKHSKEEYHNWLQRFLGPVTTEVYFYTSLDLVSTVQSARGEGLPITIDTNYNTPFDVPPLKGLEGWYNEMHALDREHSYHSPELYAIWNAKPFFVDNAIRVMASRGKTYDYVFWNDGGSFREDSVYKHWPDISRLDEIWQQGSKLSGTKAEDLLFFPIQHPPYNAKDWNEDMGPIDTDFSEGSFFGGSPSTMAWWARTFYAYHDYYISKRLFVGKDQTVFNAILVLFSERIITVWVYDPKAPAANIDLGFQSLKFFSRSNPLGSCGLEWHYYQFWLSDRPTRDGMREIWIKKEKKPESHDKGDHEDAIWKMKSQCRFTRVLALNGLLKEIFGEEWKPPPPPTLPTPVRSWQYQL